MSHRSRSCIAAEAAFWADLLTCWRLGVRFGNPQPRPITPQHMGLSAAGLSRLSAKPHRARQGTIIIHMAIMAQLTINKSIMPPHCPHYLQQPPPTNEKQQHFRQDSLISTARKAGEHCHCDHASYRETAQLGHHGCSGQRLFAFRIRYAALGDKMCNLRDKTRG